MEMIEKCLSTLFPIAGLHEWVQGKFTIICNELLGFPIDQFSKGEIHNVFMKNHKMMSPDNNIELNSPVFKLLVDDLCSTLRIKQLKRVSSVISTSLLESHHSVCLIYKPKRYHL